MEQHKREAWEESERKVQRLFSEELEINDQS